MDQRVEPLRHQVLQLDALGDEGLQVDLPLLDEPDGFLVVVAVGDGAAHVQLLHHHAVHVDGGRVAPDGDDHHHAGGLGHGHQGVEHLVDAGAFERHVHALVAGESHHLGHHVHFGGVEDVVGHAGLLRLLLPPGTQLGDDDFEPLGLQDGGQQQADGAGPAHQRHVAGLGAAAGEGMVAHRQRLDQRGLVQGNGVGDGVHPAALDGDPFGQAAAPPAQADEVHVLRQVVVVARARGHVVGHDVRFHHHVLADLDVSHPFAHGIDHAGEFVAHGDGGGFARNGMRVAAGRDEDRPFHEFVQVGAADAAPGYFDAHGAGLHHGFGNVFDADVATAVETCCFHDSTF